MRRIGFIAIVLIAALMAGCASSPIRDIHRTTLPPIISEAREAPYQRFDTNKTEIEREAEERKARLAEQPLVEDLLFVNTSITDALGDIQTQTNVMILPSEAVVGEIPYCYVEKARLEEVLEMILFVGGFSYKRYELTDGGYYYRVGTAESGSEASLIFLETRKIKTYRKARDVYAMLASPAFQPYIAITEPVATRDTERRVRNTTREYTPLVVEPEEESHELVITGSKAMVDHIEHVIRTIVDIPPKQISIQAVFVEGQFNTADQLGIDWSRGLDLSVGGSGTFTKGWNFGWQGDIMGQLLTGIQAMAQKGYLELKNYPQIVTTEGTLAQIDLRTSQHIRLEKSRNVGNESSYYSRDRTQEYITGTIMMVRPYLTDSGNITLDLAIEVDDITGINSDGLPIVSKRSVSNQVRIASGETVVIGGLYQELLKTNKAGIKGLSNIPIIGIPLSTRTNGNQAKELTVFITARILEPEWVDVSGYAGDDGSGRDSVRTITETKEIQIIIPHIDEDEWEKALDRTSKVGD